MGGSSELGEGFGESGEDQLQGSSHFQVHDVVKEKLKRRMWWRYGILVMSCCMMLSAGTALTFSSYSEALKTQLKLSQTEANTVVGISNLGLCVSVLVGALYDWKGPKWTAMGASISGFLGYLLLYFTVRYVPKNTAVMASVGMFLSIQGCLFAYQCALQTNIINFPKKHRGKVVALAESVFGASTAIINAIYDATFGKNSDPAQDNIAGWFIVQCAAFGGINLVAVFILRRMPPLEEEEGENEGEGDKEEKMQLLSSVANEEEIEAEMEQQQQKRQCSLERFQVFREPVFWLQFVITTIELGLVVVYLNNIGFIIEAVVLDQETAARTTHIVVVLQPVLGCLGRLLIGLVSDITFKWISRSAWQTLALSMLMISLWLMTFKLDSVTAIIIANAFFGFGMGLHASILPVYISELFGVENYGFNLGFLVTPSAVFGYAYNNFFAKVYDDNGSLDDSGAILCRGTDCYFESNKVSAILMCVAVLSSSIVLVLKKQKTQFV